jgi:choline dehydrogenase-like flavoprotein
LGCKFNAKANATTIAMPKARWFGAEVRENCWVRRLNTNRDGSRVESVTYLQRTPTGPGTERVEEHTIGADIVILAAGSMMTPMLLHWSGEGGSALANSSGQVGRNLRAHFMRVSTSVLNRDDVRSYQGNLVELNDQYQNYDDGYLLEINMAAPPTYFAGMAEVLSKDTLIDMLGLPFKRMMRRWPQMIVSAGLARSDDTGFTDNSVLPHAGRRNRYDDPLPTVHLEPNARELEWVDAAVEHAQRIMLNAGADPAFLMTGGLDCVHKVGTCRMGTDPAESVTDLDGKCWDLDNLWIADGSLFPAPLLANCAFVIYTLAYKVADSMLGRETPTE